MVELPLDRAYGEFVEPSTRDNHDGGKGFPGVVRRQIRRVFDLVGDAKILRSGDAHGNLEGSAVIRGDLLLGFPCLLDVSSRSLTCLGVPFKMSLLDEGFDGVFEVHAIIGDVAVAPVEPAVLGPVRMRLRRRWFREPDTASFELSVGTFNQNALAGSSQESVLFEEASGSSLLAGIEGPVVSSFFSETPRRFVVFRGSGALLVPRIPSFVGGFFLLVLDVSLSLLKELGKCTRWFDPYSLAEVTVRSQPFLEQVPFHGVGGVDLDSLLVEPLDVCS